MKNENSSYMLNWCIYRRMDISRKPLSKYHSKLGHDVTLIASTLMYDKEGKMCTSNKSGYRNKDGVYVIRLDEKKHKPYSRFRRFPKLEETLENIESDVLFVHSCQFIDINTIVKYKRKHNNIKIYVDNHADLSNSANGFISYYLLHKIIWKRMAKIIEPYTEKFYGVMPSRVDFLKTMYGLPDEKSSYSLWEPMTKKLSKRCARIVGKKLEINTI